MTRPNLNSSIVRGVQANDHDAIGRLHHHWLEELRTVARRVLGKNAPRGADQSANVDEVASSSFRDLLQGDLSAIQDGAHLWFRLVRIAIHKAQNLKGRKRRGQSQGRQELGESALADQNEFQSAIEQIPDDRLRDFAETTLSSFLEPLETIDEDEAAKPHLAVATLLMASYSKKEIQEKLNLSRRKYERIERNIKRCLNEFISSEQ